MQYVDINLTKSEAAEAILKLEGAQYSLTDYPMFKDIFNSTSNRVLMKAGRQVSKTITMGADMVTTAAVYPYTPLIYCNASQAQTSAFSTSKLDPFLLHSPAIHNDLMSGNGAINNVYHKRMGNSSEIRLSYFSEDADRVRGNSGKKMYLDEIQDMLYDAIIDANECLSAAKVPQTLYAGTSKTSASTLEYFWGMSSQKEWIVKCSCGKWNLPDVKNISEDGFVCKDCGGLLNTYSGHWHSFADPDYDWSYDGYHIPQIILPLHCDNPTKWKEILRKQREYPEYKFNNEVMGIADGEASQPITEAMVKEACAPNLVMEEKRSVANGQGASFFVGGIDWGGGGQAGNSTTTLSIYAVYPERNRFINVYGKVYGTGEPAEHVRHIGHMLNSFGVTMCMADHGGGNFAISQLREVCPSINLVPVMYTDQSKPYNWDGDAQRYTVNRTVMIDAFVLDLKKRDVELFRWEEFKAFAPHLTCMYVDSVGGDQGKGRRVWRHPPANPDDYLHSLVFGWFGSRVVSGSLDFTAASLPSI